MIQKNMEVPFSSMTGIGTARALAKLYDIVANGGKHSGQTLLCEKIIKKIQTNALVSGTDVVLSIPAKVDPGLIVSMENPLGDPAFVPCRIWGGGGQVAAGDTKYRVGFAHLTNHLDPCSNAEMTLDLNYCAVYETIRDLESKKKKTLITNNSSLSARLESLLPSSFNKLKGRGNNIN